MTRHVRPIATITALTLCFLLAGCNLLRPPTGHGVPPEGSRDAIVADVIEALDSEDHAQLAALFPSQPAEDIRAMFDNCGAIEPSTRVIPDIGEIVPYSLTVYMSGSSEPDGEPGACYFNVRWEGENGPWALTSQSITPSQVPTLSP